MIAVPCAVWAKLPDDLLWKVIRAADPKTKVNLLATNQKLWERRGNPEVWEGCLPLVAKPFFFEKVFSEWNEITIAVCVELIGKNYRFVMPWDLHSAQPTPWHPDCHPIHLSSGTFWHTLLACYGAAVCSWRSKQ